ncbi:phage major capsid protein [Mycolicibacter algericus]|uniref:Major capsid protein n=2 Tax=Mycolicibacter algericus TaxID=1288388 RepID=A0A7I9Y4I1_MYCAL|nr:phage major capsid protein [Mycolicibacter algericus]OQZ96921.1 capsid protein [Mycolicibacter algericus DSM 45454]GFG83383.1 major capsid protein [Mycolicibacter algericus]
MAVELTHKQAVNRERDIQDELERLKAKADKTPEDTKQVTVLLDEFREVHKHRLDLEHDAALAEIRSAITNDPVSVERGTAAPRVVDTERAGGPSAPSLGGKFRNPWDTSTVRFGQPGAEVEMRHRAEDAVERMSFADDKVREVSAQLVGNDESMRTAEMVLATTSPDYSRAFAKIVRHNGQVAALSREEQDALQRSMAIGTGSAGGYLVPFQLDPAVILTAAGSFNQVRQISRVVQSVSGTWHGVSSAGVTGSWDAEATEVSDDSPTLAQPTITAGKGQVFVEASFEAVQDASNLAQELATMMAFEKDRMESVAFVTGSGSGQPKGVITALADVGTSVVETAAASTLALADVYKLDESLPARWAANGSWLAHRAIYNKLRQFDTAGGAALWGHLDEARKRDLLGRPNYVAEAMASTVVDSANVLVFGDFSNYVIADRIGTTIEYIPNLFGANGRPTGKRGWLTHFRVGADVVNPAAFRLLQIQDA